MTRLVPAPTPALQRGLADSVHKAGSAAGRRRRVSTHSSYLRHQAPAGARSGAALHLLPGKVDPRGYVRVWLGKGHPYAQKSGQVWRHRLVVMADLGRRLRADEHVHHVNGVKGDDRLENLQVLSAWYHGSLHAYYVVTAKVETSHIAELDTPEGPWRAGRRGAVIQANGFRGAA